MSITTHTVILYLPIRWIRGERKLVSAKKCMMPQTILCSYAILKVTPEMNQARLPSMRVRLRYDHERYPYFSPVRNRENPDTMMNMIAATLPMIYQRVSEIGMISRINTSSRR
jgi:hypothetical protein